LEVISQNLSIRQRLRPSRGFAHFFHLGLVAFVPPIIYILVRLDLASVAFAVILLSKWRIFAVRPRHWLAHIRTNAVDIIFSLSILAFMTATSSMAVQILWVVVYEIWVLFLKPGSSPILVTVQALLAQLAGLLALFIAFEDAPLSVYIASTAAILYFSARHFFGSFEEDNSQAYSWLWALFGACLVWVLGHWLLFYGPIAQVALLISVIGYGLGALYFLSETDRLSKLVQRQVVFVMVAVVAVLLILSNWGNRGV
jgi:hypothetical protein